MAASRLRVEGCGEVIAERARLAWRPASRGKDDMSVDRLEDVVAQNLHEPPVAQLLFAHPGRGHGDAEPRNGASDHARAGARAHANFDRRLFASPAALESPEFANGVGRAAEAIVIREIRDRDGNAAAIEVFWRGDDDPGGARELAGQERRIGLI